MIFIQESSPSSQKSQLSNEEQAEMARAIRRNGRGSTML